MNQVINCYVKQSYVPTYKALDNVTVESVTITDKNGKIFQANNVFVTVCNCGNIRAYTLGVNSE